MALAAAGGDGALRRLGGLYQPLLLSRRLGRDRGRRAGRRQRRHPGGDLFHDRAVAAAGDFWGRARGWLGAAPVLAGVGTAVSGQIHRTGAMILKKQAVLWAD